MSDRDLLKLFRFLKGNATDRDKGKAINIPVPISKKLLIIKRKTSIAIKK